MYKYIYVHLVTYVMRQRSIFTSKVKTCMLYYFISEIPKLSQTIYMHCIIEILMPSVPQPKSSTVQHKTHKVNNKGFIKLEYSYSQWTIVLPSILFIWKKLSQDVFATSSLGYRWLKMRWKWSKINRRVSVGVKRNLEEILAVFKNCTLFRGTYMYTQALL